MAVQEVIELRPGSVVADFRIERLLARGGMGVVYEAVQLSNGRRVALKVIAPELGGDYSFRERFERESHVAIRLEHPHVVPAYATGEADGVLFMAMRFIDGVDLRQVIRFERRLAPERAVALVAQIASGLDAAHRLGLVHRDVKPGNVMVESLGPGREHCYVMDFGLAKQSGSTGYTRTGSWVGTLDYVAPEQITGGNVDARADVYSLGGLLYHALVGHPPYAARHDAAKMFAHLHLPPPRPSATFRDVPLRLDDVVARALAKDPDARFPSAGDLARAATAAVGGTEPLTHERSVAIGDAAPRAGADAWTEPGGIAVGSGAPRRGRRWMIAGLAALALAIVAAGAVAIGQSGNGTPQPGPAAHRVDKFLVTASGAVGRLQLGRSTAADIEAVAGQPNAPVVRSAGSPPYGGYSQIGYGCAVATPSQAIKLGEISLGGSNTACSTVYSISQKTMRLTAFQTEDMRFHTVRGISPGMPETIASRREGRGPTVLCGSILAIDESTKSVGLLVHIVGGTPGPSVGGQPTVVNGTVGIVSAEASHPGLGLTAASNC